jgi:hypothetical protein
MAKLAPRGLGAAATSLVLSIAFLAALCFPAAGIAAGGPGPELAFTPSPLDFGKTTVGAESTTTTVDVYNAGGAAAPIDGVAVEGANAGDFKVTSNGCGPVEPGQHCTVSVVFSPGSVGAREAALVLQLKEAPAQSVQLTGTGVPAQLAFTPGGHDFGIQHVNRGEASASFQLTNLGEATARLNSVGIGGADTHNFWVNGGNCGSNFWLQPGESCNVQVVFNPFDMVDYEAELQAYAGGETFGATLTGTGGRPIVEPTSSPTEFGATTVGTAGAVQTIVMVNHGNLAANFFIGIVAGGDAGSFRLLDEDCGAAPVPPSGSCTAHVSFLPQGPGPKVARLAFFGDDDSNTMALLQGEGVAPAVTLAPAAHDFGPQATGTRSAPHAFAVRNEGGTPLDLDGVAIVGADLDQFALGGDECTGATLAPGAECLVRVRFAPDSAGAKAATLRVRGAAGAFTAALTGTASAPDGQQVSAGADPTTRSAGTPPRRARHRRFARGNSLPGGKRPRPRRVAVRASVAPR